jgi:excisionase family DNA binding protein
VTDRLLDAKEAAELLNVKVGWIRAQTRAGNMPHIKLGRYPRYDERDLRAWVESLKTGGGPTWRKHRPQLTDNYARIDNG